MLGWLKRKKEPYIEEEILNEGLNMAMSFGEHWLQPVNLRLSKLYPALSDEELDLYNSRVQEAMKFGHGTAYSIAQRKGKESNLTEFRDIYIKEYPWVNTKNVKSLFSQGMYYAYKDMGF